MNMTTITKLKIVGRAATTAFICDLNHGFIHRDRIQADFDSLGNKQTAIEFIKKTLRSDRHLIEPIWREIYEVKLSNILKTPQQLNYLANEIVAGLKRRILNAAEVLPFLYQ